MKLYSMKLYHGTPNDFDEFDTEHIGSGEGHQFHGWGLYFAADKQIVTDRYAERLAQRNMNIVITIDGVEYSHSARKYDWIAETMSEMANNKAFDFNEYDVVKLLLLNHDWWDDTAKEHIEKNIRNYQAKVDAGEGDERIFISNDFPPLTAEESLKLNQDVLKYIEDHDVKYEIHTPKSSVFTIEVPDDLVFLDEDEYANETILHNLGFLSKEEKITELTEMINDILVSYMQNNNLVMEIKHQDQIPYWIEKFAHWIADDLVYMYLDNEEREWGNKLNVLTDENELYFLFGRGLSQINWKPVIPEILKLVESKEMNVMDITKGEKIYSNLVGKLGGSKEASLYLEQHGINGITYYGREDGRCYVVFNPNHIKIIEKEQI